MGLELITMDESLPDDVIERNFPDLWVTMLTLCAFVTMDNAVDIYFGMIKEKWYLTFYFFSFIMLVSIALMNLLTAIVVEGSLEQARKDEEVAKQHKKTMVQRMLPRIYQVFKIMDADGSGDITLAEIKNAPALVQQEFQTLVGSSAKLEELFGVMDVDDSGVIDVDEFFDGVCRIATSDMPLETLRVMKQIGRAEDQIHVVKNELADIKTMLTELLNKSNTREPQ
jgi:Ca2+-binding EF-hand superfamily protein